MNTEALRTFPRAFINTRIQAAVDFCNDLGPERLARPRAHALLERAQAVTDVGDKRTAHRKWASEWGFRDWEPTEDYQAWRKAAYKAFKSRSATAMAAGALAPAAPMAALPAQELASSPPPSALPPPRGWMLRDFAAALDADDAAKAAAAQAAASQVDAKAAAKAAIAAGMRRLQETPPGDFLNRHFDACAASALQDMQVSSHPHPHPRPHSSPSLSPSPSPSPSQLPLSPHPSTNTLTGL